MSLIKFLLYNHEFIGADTSCDLLQVSPGTLGGLTVSMNGFTVYSIATYSCNELGYILNDTINRVCQNDGTWTGTVPFCQCKIQYLIYCK